MKLGASDGILDGDDGARDATHEPNTRAPTILGYRDMVLRRVVPKETKQDSPIFGIETASRLRETFQERWGAKPPNFPGGSPGGRRPFRPPQD